MDRPYARQKGSSTAPGDDPSWSLAIGVIVFLALLLISQYGSGLRDPFVSDDFYFLAKTQHASFSSVWLRRDLEFAYWRPFSRELHFWVLTHLFGARELPFHLVAMGLALGAGTLYFFLVSSLAGAGVAATATAAIFALGAWATPLIWGSGAQDLWMLVFVLATMLCLVRGRYRLMHLFLVPALLSKELACVTPAIALAYLLVVERRPLRKAVSLTLGLWAITLAWAVVHPTLGDKVDLPPAPEAFGLPPLTSVEVARRTLFSIVNLEEWPRPEHGWGPVLGTGAIAAVLLGSIVLAGTWTERRRAAATSAKPHLRVIAFGVCWALIAWLPVFVPSVGWRAYYVLLGNMGAWIAVATLLSRRPALALSLVAAVALVRAGRATTPSRDWGSEWYQRRSTAFNVETRNYFLAHYPTMPRGSRLYFSRVPGRRGLIPGVENSFAFQLWYGDTTLRTDFISHYQQGPPVPGGRDHFFTYDTTLGWKEVPIVTLPPQPTARQRLTYAEFLWNIGLFSDARAQYEQLVALAPERWDYAFNLGSTIMQQGDSAEAARWYLRAAQLPGAPEGIIGTAERSRRYLTR